MLEESVGINSLLHIMGICPIIFRRSTRAEADTVADGLAMGMLQSDQPLAVNLNTTNDQRFLYFVLHWELGELLG